MIKVLKQTVEPLSANAYTVVDDNTKKCLIIDCGGDFLNLMTMCEEQGYEICGLLFTHGHFDHALSGYLAKDYGIKTYISKGDGYMLSSKDNLAERFGLNAYYYSADETFGEETFEVGGIKIQPILTPGHTDGSACFIIDGKLFTGDTLFLGTYGNTRFPSGSFAKIKQSIKSKLFALDGDYEVFPGHGENTTLERERKQNFINYDNY